MFFLLTWIIEAIVEQVDDVDDVNDVRSWKLWRRIFADRRAPVRSPFSAPFVLGFYQIKYVF